MEKEEGEIEGNPYTYKTVPGKITIFLKRIRRIVFVALIDTEFIML